MPDISSNKPVITILTLAVALIVVVVGGVVTITNPQTLSFHQYVQDVAFMAGAIGLGAGIGRGIDSHGQAQAIAKPLTGYDMTAVGGNVAPDIPIEEVGPLDDR